MSSPSPDRRVRLREPALLFGPIAPVLLFIVALFCASFINTGFSDHAPVAARGLLVPALIGLILTLIALVPRLRRLEVASRIALVRRAAISFAIAGCLWPLSFGLAGLLQGDANALLGSLAPALLGLLVGAVSGAAAGAAAAFACFRLS